MEDDDTHDTTFTRLGQTRALKTLRSGLALARERHEAEFREALIAADQRIRTRPSRAQATRRLLAKL